VYRFYLKNTPRINNWDLVDVSAPNIVGTYCVANGTQPLYRLAKSKRLWERRISIVATLANIRAGNYKPTSDIAALLLHDREDLIHKASGWMLREMGKRDTQVLLTFLNTHAGHMPRTMLRYSIERLPLSIQKKYRAKKLT
jgi:3-methyladenine DNA glycosylase AlkD